MAIRYIVILLLLFLIAPNQIYCQDTNDNQVIAEVNGHKIMLKDYNDAVTDKENKMMIKFKKDDKMGVLDAMINRELVYKEAVNKKIDTMPEVIVQLENAKKDILFKALITKEVTEKVSYTEEDMKKYYEKNKENYEPVIVTADVISISKQNRNKNNPSEEEAVKIAREIREKLSDGKRLLELIDEYTKTTNLVITNKSFTNKSKSLFSANQKALMDKIFAMDQGTISILDFSGLIFVVRVIDKQHITSSFEREKNKIDAELQSQLWKEAYKAFTTTLREHAEIKITDKLIE